MTGQGRLFGVRLVPLCLSFPSLLACGSVLPVWESASRQEEGAKPKATSLRGFIFLFEKGSASVWFPCSSPWLEYGYSCLEGGWGNGVFRLQPLCQRKVRKGAAAGYQVSHSTSTCCHTWETILEVLKCKNSDIHTVFNKPVNQTQILIADPRAAMLGIQLHLNGNFHNV